MIQSTNHPDYVSQDFSQDETTEMEICNRPEPHHWNTELLLLEDLTTRWM
ncbi:hypothetical protein M4951_25600 [Blastopirellula sp. J2-11]|nr:hypothetical protein [Blastopirellula sp. J2-11]UUO06705.1 hypothetical protein M4951_25600 [Blastopirellula sp. J2-11]